MKNSEMSFVFYDTGHVVISEAWWRGQPRENVSAGTRNRRKTEVGESRICCFVPPKTFLRNKTPPQIHFVRSKTFIWNQLMWTTSVWPWKRCK